VGAFTIVITAVLWAEGGGGGRRRARACAEGHIGELDFEHCAVKLATVHVGHKESKPVLEKEKNMKKEREKNMNNTHFM
jgi:hypothetical protein